MREELRNLDGVTEDGLRVFNIEPHTYTAVGSESASGRAQWRWPPHGPSFHGRGNGAHGSTVISDSCLVKFCFCSPSLSRSHVRLAFVVLAFVFL